MDRTDFLDLYSDDDEEIIEYISRPIVRQVFPRSDLFNTLSEDKFKRRFRLNKATTLILLHQIEQHLIFGVERLVFK